MGGTGGQAQPYAAMCGELHVTHKFSCSHSRASSMRVVHSSVVSATAARASLIGRRCFLLLCCSSSDSCSLACLPLTFCNSSHLHVVRSTAAQRLMQLCEPGPAALEHGQKSGSIWKEHLQSTTQQMLAGMTCAQQAQQHQAYHHLGVLICCPESNDTVTCNEMGFNFEFLVYENVNNTKNYVWLHYYLPNT